MFNYLSFSFSSFLFCLFLIKRPDVVYVYNLVTLGPTAFLIRLFFRAKVVIDVQDLWPDSVTQSGMLSNPLMNRILSFISNWVYHRADRLVVLSPGFKERLVERGIRSEKIDVVYNWCDENALCDSARSSDPAGGCDMEGKFTVLFAGTMGVMQGLDTVLECAALCQTSVPQAQFVLVGGGADRSRLVDKAKEMKLTNLKFLPTQPPSAMGPIYARSDILLVHLKNNHLFEITIPSKTQAYLFMGKPLLAAMRGNTADLVRRAGAGIVCEPDDPAAMAKAVKLLYDLPETKRMRMGESGRNFYMRHLSFDEGVTKFEQILLSASNLRLGYGRR
jgi:glycosyltransferase involved in cell wall biosynthesis